MTRKLVNENTNEWATFHSTGFDVRVVHLRNSTSFLLFFARKAYGFCNYTDDEGKMVSQGELLARLAIYDLSDIPGSARLVHNSVGQRAKRPLSARI